MDWNKLTHSKCPVCRERGLPALKTGYRFSDKTVRCKHCGRAFATNLGINILVELGSLALIAWACFSWVDPTFENETIRKCVVGALFVLWFLVMYTYEYFAPLHEREE